MYRETDSVTGIVFRGLFSERNWWGVDHLVKVAAAINSLKFKLDGPVSSV